MFLNNFFMSERFVILQYMEKTMKNAYLKALLVIDSCKNTLQTLGAYNYIWNFSKLFVDSKGCKELHARCSRKRKMVENK